MANASVGMSRVAETGAATSAHSLAPGICATPVYAQRGI
jgi:hypothetical protein